MTSNSAATGAYAAGAMEYLPEWSPIPIQTIDGDKVPLVTGVSGYKGVYVDREMAREWIASERAHKRAAILLRDASIGLRLPKDVIGIDVDNYGEKQGMRTMALLQRKWGALEQTWCSTSRTDGSGIYLYRLREEDISKVGTFRNPAGEFENGDPIGGIDIVRYCHRFVTVFPTFHGREGGIHQYRWYTPEGEVADCVPLPEDFPYLPAGWVKGLAVGRTYAAGETKLEGRASDWLKARPKGDGPLCSKMLETLTGYLEEVIHTGKAGGCYPTANKGLFALVGNAAEGHAGAFLAVSRLWETYRDAMGARSEGGRSPASVEREFIESLRGAIEALPRNKFRDYDPCGLDL